MFLFVTKQSDREILRDRINLVAHLDDSFVAFDGRIFRGDDAFDYSDEIGGILGRLQIFLLAFQLHGAWDASAQHFDPLRQHHRVAEFFLDVGGECLLNLFRAHAIEIDRVGEVILNRLQLTGVGVFQFGEDFFTCGFVHGREGTVAPRAARFNPFQMANFSQEGPLAISRTSITIVIRMMRKGTLLLGCTALFSLTALVTARDAGSKRVPAPSVPLAFNLPLPIIPKLAPTSSDPTTDYYDVTMQVGQKEIVPGLLTTIWGYNGLYPGPTIVAQRGRRAVVRQVNNLQESMSVHLHGGHTPPESDGLPYDLIGPGATKTYEYPNNQPAATLWYHDHAIDTTGRHVYMGLAAFYLISDPAEVALGLPSGANDVALMIQDRLFNTDGSLNYPLNDSTVTTGVIGNTLLVNGVIQPYFEVARRKVRFRIVNGSNARIYRLALSTGQPLLQIASDGGLLRSPVSRSSITVAPGERIEVVIDFAKYALGTTLILKNLNTTSPLIPDLMRFDVVREEADQSTVPTTLGEIESLPPDGVVPITRLFTLEPGTVKGRTVWTINGLLYDPARVDVAPRLNQTEIWTFQNNSGVIHPMHIHDIQWQIVDINGVPPAAGDDGLKDTFLVPARGTVRVIGHFTDNVGSYVSHCHNLEHEDHAMMFNFVVQP